VQPVCGQAGRLRRDTAGAIQDPSSLTIIEPMLKEQAMQAFVYEAFSTGTVALTLAV
jgi:hypothetical protein